MNQTSDDCDLLTAPWISVPTPNGETVPVGILQAFQQADRLAGITDPSPLATFGLYRLLLAVLHRYLELQDAEAWGELWEEGRFPDSFLTRVQAACADRMRLFDPQRPFYQSGDIRLDTKPAEPLKSVGYLAPEAPTGTNIAHFDHAGEDTHAYCPACCTKGLIQLPVFALAGGAGIKPGINGVPPLYVLPCGQNLFRTLMLNYLLPPYRPSLAAAQDPGPLWEATSRVDARKEKDTTGFVESLTWPPRRVRLFPDAGGVCSRCGNEANTLVRRMVFAQGWSRHKELPPWRDPWAAYAARRAAGGTQSDLIPVRPSEHREVWRDFPSLFLESAPGQTERPQILDQIASLQGDVLPRRLSIRHEVFGLRTDMKAKIFEWRQDTFLFPAALLASPPAGQAIRQALAYASHVDDALQAGLKLLFLPGPALQEFGARLRRGDGMKLPPVEFNRLDPVVYATRREFWGRLEARFRRGVGDYRLIADDEQDLVAWSKDWQEHADGTAQAALSGALRTYDGEPEAVLRQVCAQSMFRAVLRSWKGGQS
jgi:CRISPR system Cascade subunit CasA